MVDKEETKKPEEKKSEQKEAEVKEKVEETPTVGKNTAPAKPGFRKLGGDGKKQVDIEQWKPKTEIGKNVKKGTITDIDEVLVNGHKILEETIVEVLIPELESDLLLIGQSKGKFGGGQRRVFRQTQKKTKEGNKPSFATYAVVGDHNGHVGVGYGK